MKLQKCKKRIRGKTYYQYMLTVPPTMVNLLKLEGSELSWELNNKGRLEVIQKKPNKKLLRGLGEVLALTNKQYPTERYIKPMS
ncbi:MAG: hypothetical protein ACE5J5_03275 [Candidatus Hydrothermarchaeales archaeon]